MQDIDKIFALQKLTSEQKTKIAKISHLRAYKAGELIYNYGQASAIYAISKGSVALYKRNENQVERIRVFDKGTIFGCEALAEIKERHHFARTCEESELLVFLGDDIEQLTLYDSFLTIHIYRAAITSLSLTMEQLAQQYTDLTHQLIDSDIIL